MSTNHLQNRHIAFLDILGFSERLRREPLEALHRTYADLIDDARTRALDSRDTSGKPSNNFAWSKFLFDSVVLISNETTGTDGPTNTWKFIGAVVLLHELSFARAMPLRGCVGHGDVLEDADRGILLSPVFPELVKLEKSFQWSGSVLLPAAAECVLRDLHFCAPEDLPPCASNLLIRYLAPSKTPPLKPLWCLNWVHLSSPAALRSGLEFLNDEKRAPTRAYIDFVESLPAQEQVLPEKFGPAVRVRCQVARSGMRLKFCDIAGDGVDPPDGVTLEIVLMSPPPRAG